MCLTVVKSDILAPVGVIVAPLATVAELPFVRILVLVTRDARGLKLLLIEVSSMTDVAFHLFVCSTKRKLGLVVLKFCLFPLDLVVAGFALRTVTIGMNILDPVTGDAGLGQILIQLTSVAGGARDVLMRPDQRKLCFSMIEGLYVAPDGG